MLAIIHRELLPVAHVAHGFRVTGYLHHAELMSPPADGLRAQFLYTRFLGTRPVESPRLVPSSAVALGQTQVRALNPAMVIWPELVHRCHRQGCTAYVCQQEASHCVRSGCQHVQPQLCLNCLRSQYCTPSCQDA